jgi:hypothetical protein
MHVPVLIVLHEGTEPTEAAFAEAMHDERSRDDEGRPQRTVLGWDYYGPHPKWLGGAHGPALRVRELPPDFALGAVIVFPACKFVWIVVERADHWPPEFHREWVRRTIEPFGASFCKLFDAHC